MSTPNKSNTYITFTGHSGFIFKDDLKQPFFVAQEQGCDDWWLHYYNFAYRGFATLRKLTPGEVECFHELAIPASEAVLHLPGATPLNAA